MSKIAEEVKEILPSNGITITVEYLPRSLNKLAGQEKLKKLRFSLILPHFPGVKKNTIEKMLVA